MNKGGGNRWKESDMNHISTARPGRMLLDWTRSIRRSEKLIFLIKAAGWVTKPLTELGKAKEGRGIETFQKQKRGVKRSLISTSHPKELECKRTSSLHHSQWGALRSEVSQPLQALDTMMRSGGTGDVGDQLTPGHKPLEHRRGWERGGWDPWGL